MVGSDNYLYGIPYAATRIVKFDPTNPDTTSTVGEEAKEYFDCENGVGLLLAGDGFIYAANRSGQALQIEDATNNDYTWIGDRIYSRYTGMGWGDPIVGIDKCIYWTPRDANRVLKFDPDTQQLPSLVGDDLGEGRGKLLNGALVATDGAIYCISSCSNQILVIDPFMELGMTRMQNNIIYTQILVFDPFKELVMTMQNNIIKYPEELGRLFARDGCNETFYDSAVRKFGIEKVFEFLVPSDKEWAGSLSGNLPLFMVAASCDN